jgi:hypothetical protein
VPNFPCRKKALRDKGGGRTLLGNNMGNRTVMLWLMQFQCFGVCILIGLHCIYITDHKHNSILTCEKFINITLLQPVEKYRGTFAPKIRP